MDDSPITYVMQIMAVCLWFHLGIIFASTPDSKLRPSSTTLMACFVEISLALAAAHLFVAFADDKDQALNSVWFRVLWSVAIGGCVISQACVGTFAHGIYKLCNQKKFWLPNLNIYAWILYALVLISATACGFVRCSDPISDFYLFQVAAIIPGVYLLLVLSALYDNDRAHKMLTAGTMCNIALPLLFPIIARQVYDNNITVYSASFGLSLALFSTWFLQLMGMHWFCEIAQLPCQKFRIEIKSERVSTLRDSKESGVPISDEYLPLTH